MEREGEKLDIIIFGATGFTGKIVVYKIIDLAKEKGISWGIAGRNKNKLEDVLKVASEKSGENLDTIPVVLADVEDELSLQQMAARARIVINCVGPYRFFGEAVVKACISAGTHHVDISGEPQYIERMQLEYHKAAEEKGVYIISACGFDSIPSDMGTVFLRNEHKGDLNSIEAYVDYGCSIPLKGAIGHYATWESAVHGIANHSELRPLRQKLFPTRLPTFSPKLEVRSMLHKRDDVNGWCMAFPSSDLPVMLRSQRYFFEHDKLRPAQVNVYVTYPSIFTVLLLSIVGFFLTTFSKFEWGRKLLLEYPRLFTCGLISHEGPTQETLDNTYFNILMFGDGWSERLAEPTDQHDSPPNKTVAVKVSGKDPGYGLTSVMVILTAITVLKENDKMPSSGGVYPPAAAFAKTSLIEELEKHGMKFEVISVKEN